MKIREKIIILAIIASMAVAAAKESPADSAKYHFDPVVVTATKVAGAQRDIAASVSVINEKMLMQSGSSTVLDAVNALIPGTFITERAVYGYGVAAGAAGGISIRGVGGTPVTGVLVLRDGRPDIMGQMGHPIADAYSLAGVERIEIVRGPASFLYGTNAMGGVINIVSKKMKRDGFRTNIGGGVASFNSKNLSFFHGGKRGDFEYYITAETKLSDGHRAYSNYEGDFYSAHLGYVISPATNISVNANLSNIYLLDPGSTTNPRIDNWYDLRRSGIDVTYNHSGRVGDSYIRLHGNFGRHRIYDGWRSKDRTVGLMLYHNVSLFRGNTTTLGFDVKQYGGDADDSTPKLPVIDYSKHFVTEYAPYLHTQQMMFRRILLSGGLRLEKHQLYGTELLPKFGLVAHASTVTSLRLSVSKGFRSPSIRELYIFPPRNERLLPEQLWNYEIGLTQTLWKTARVDGSLFKSKGRNIIRLVAPPPQFLNSDQFTHSGYEIVFEWLPVKFLMLSTTWSKLDLGDDTMNIPGKKLTAFVSCDFGKTQLSLLVMNIRDLYGADFHRKKMENYTLANLFLSIRPYQSVGFRLGIKNLLDTNYQTLYDYPMPGRMLSFNMNYFL